MEAGAYEARVSLRVAAGLPACRVIEFEANPYMYKGFSESTDYAARGVEYRHQALVGAPDKGRISFFVITSSSSGRDDRREGYNSLLNRKADNWLNVSEYEEAAVPATTLDRESGDVDGPFALWMDVEGASKEVLSGAQTFLDRCDIAKIEVEDQVFWEAQWLATDVVAEMAGPRMELVARDIEGGRQYNVLIASRRLLARADVQNRISRFNAEGSGHSAPVTPMSRSNPA
ncbi:FkbM family methyltransferase [Streptomyces lavendulae]|uniref:FkbM family methyltransferase n=1 Tax=Streptomyces lavendulae TaxID=1914 RepID=UPI0033D74F47